MPVYKHLGIETGHENIIFIRKDSEICISEGFEALNRVRVRNGGRSIVAGIQVLTTDNILKQGETGLSNEAAQSLHVKEGDSLLISHLDQIDSLAHIRSKIYGNNLSDDQFQDIITDIVQGKYANVHLSAFITACAGDSLTTDEIHGLTQAMVNAGQRMQWQHRIIADKHCVGGLPGNRTTPIVVSIIAAAGLVIPKTSSHAITSPAGTADTVGVITKVDLTLEKFRQVVDAHGGGIVSGERYLSPADDVIIRVERALDIDSEGQMIASVLSKKAAAGSTHLLVDIPVGPTAKVRSEEDAERLKFYFKVVGKALGLKIKVLITDGSQPVGRGIGPGLEAMDVLAVLRNESDASKSLKMKSLHLAGEILQLTGVSKEGEGLETAAEILESGRALDKFVNICKAQGGFNEPDYAPYSKDILAERVGSVKAIDNRRLAKLAKLAGAPSDTLAGVKFMVSLGDQVKKGDLLFTVYAESKGELAYALRYLKGKNEIVSIYD
jgi:thymidine phosphorylase